MQDAQCAKYYIVFVFQPLKVCQSFVLKLAVLTGGTAVSDFLSGSQVRSLFLAKLRLPVRFWVWTGSPVRSLFLVKFGLPGFLTGSPVRSLLLAEFRSPVRFWFRTGLPIRSLFSDVGLPVRLSLSTGLPVRSFAFWNTEDERFYTPNRGLTNCSYLKIKELFVFNCFTDLFKNWEAWIINAIGEDYNTWLILKSISYVLATPLMQTTRDAYFRALLVTWFHWQTRYVHACCM